MDKDVMRLPERNRGNTKDYDRILREFGAATKPNSECLNYLVTLGYTRGQARNALYRFRTRGEAVTKNG